jgi:hypothetical protein
MNTELFKSSGRNLSNELVSAIELRMPVIIFLKQLLLIYFFHALSCKNLQREAVQVDFPECIWQFGSYSAF